MANLITSFTEENAPLSNFWPFVHGKPIAPLLDIEIEGIVFPTSEHGFVALKTLSRKTRRKISEIPTPGQAKRFGRRLVLRPDWESVKMQAMETVLRKKFRDPDLRRFLINTAPARLIEGNTWGDKFWGAVWINGEWVGQNNLGKLLMKIRGDITDY